MGEHHVSTFATWKEKLIAETRPAARLGLQVVCVSCRLKAERRA